MPLFAANLSMMFNEVPFLDRFAAARRAGFEGVEFLFPYDFPAADLRTRLSGEGLTQALFNMPPGDWANGERGIASRTPAGRACSAAQARLVANTAVAVVSGTPAGTIPAMQCISRQSRAVA